MKFKIVLLFIFYLDYWVMTWHLLAKNFRTKKVQPKILDIVNQVNHLFILHPYYCNSRRINHITPNIIFIPSTT